MQTFLDTLDLAKEKRIAWGSASEHAPFTSQGGAHSERW
jgi:hypothetical protein